MAQQQPLEQHFKVLFTKDLGKKRKVYQDGVLVVYKTPGNSKLVVLQDEDHNEIRKVNERYVPGKAAKVGDEFQIGQYLVKIDEETRVVYDQSPTKKIKTESSDNMAVSNEVAAPVSAPVMKRQFSTTASLLLRKAGVFKPATAFRTPSLVQSSSAPLQSPPVSTKEEESSSSFFDVPDPNASSFMAEAKPFQPPRAQPMSSSSFASQHQHPEQQSSSNPMQKKRVIIRNDVRLDSSLQKVMKAHQVIGANFLLDCLLRSNPHDIDSSSIRGAILADEMGLGKTLIIISVIWTLVQHDLGKTVVVCPSSLLGNWVAEFKRWLSFKINPLVIKSGADTKSAINTFSISTSSKFPVLLMSYEMFRKVGHQLNMNSSIALLVCDEGHRLKNVEGTKTMDALRDCRASKRIVMTGTPVQNDLEELYVLVSFVRPGFLGSLNCFRDMYQEYVTTRDLLQQKKDARDDHEEDGDEEADDNDDNEYAKKKPNLRELLKHIMLRRTQEDVLSKLLPPRHDFIINFHMPEAMCRLYDEQVREIQRSLRGSNCSYDEFYAAETMETTSTMSASAMCILPFLAQLRQLVILGESRSSSSSSAQLQCGSGIRQQMLPPKMQFVSTMLDQLKEEQHSTDKVVIITGYMEVLDKLSMLVEGKGMGPVFRLDGRVPSDKRQRLVDEFNRPSNTTRRVFLLSVKTGGVGLNLIGANRLVMMDLDWNPATDRQAMGRIWRQGQRKEVFIYRLIMSGSLEETMLTRQNDKNALGDLVEGGSSNAASTSSGSSSSVSNAKGTGVSGQDVQSMVYPRGKNAVDLLQQHRAAEKGEAIATQGLGLDDLENTPPGEVSAESSAETLSQKVSEVLKDRTLQVVSADSLLTMITGQLGKRVVESVRVDHQYMAAPAAQEE